MNKIVAFISTIIWVLTWFWEPIIFNEENRMSHIGDYFICRAVLLFFIYCCCNFMWNLLVLKKTKERQVILYSIPYMAILAIFWELRGIYPLEADELIIFHSAQNYDPYRFFTCYTGYFYIICMMLIPSMLSIVLVKLLLNALVVGYLIYRMKNIFNSNWVYLLYGVFCLWPALLMAINVHRLPIYSILYLFVFTKIFVDYYERKKVNICDMMIAILGLSILSWWRTESIYLVVMGILIIFIAYRLKKEQYVKMIALYILCQIIVMMPQMLPTQFSDSSYAAKRMAPFYDYTLETMIDAGLEVSDGGAEWSAIEHYWETEENYEEYVDAAKKIIIKNPTYFVKARIKSWNYISFGEFENKRFSGIAVIDIIMHCFYLIMYNLYIPLISVIIVGAYSLYKKSWLIFLYSMCGIIHTGLCFLLMPAAFFKYFYIMYLMGWIYICIMSVRLINIKINNENDKMTV